MMKFILQLSFLVFAPLSGYADERVVCPQDPAKLFSSFTPPKPVPEIMNLKPGEAVPPNVYKKYPSKQIALTIVYKKYIEDEASASEKIEHPAFDYLHDSEIQLAFDEKNISSIANRGFLNTFQLDKTYENYLRSRVTAENKLLGYRLDKLFPSEASMEVHPKYAYFSIQAGGAEKNPLNSDPQGLNLGYGNVFAVFNEDVKCRTTFTMGDSMFNQDKSLLRTLRYRSESSLEMHTQDSSLIYMEAQVWGSLTIRDVNYFITNCDQRPDPYTKEPRGKISNVGLAELEKLNLPIFSCDEDKVNGRLIRIRKGKQIFFPSSKSPVGVPSEAEESQQRRGESQSAE